MKQIIYKIFKGEKSSNVKIRINEEVFQFLDSPISWISGNVLPNSITNQITIVIDKYYDIHYDILFYYLSLNVGIQPGEVGDFTVEDYSPDTITVHVYLNEE
jgi:hypothetical protein